MKAKFTNPRPLARLLLVLLLGIFTNLGAQAQPSCVCNTEVNVTLDSDGLATISSSMLLADGSTCGGSTYVIVSETMNGPAIPGSPIVDCSYIGKTLFGKVVFTGGSGNSCWTRLIIEDKMKPVITCPTSVLTLTCFEMSTFTPVVNDNCGYFKLDTIGETVLVNNCNVGLAANVLKRVTRSYQATDASGNKSDICQIVFDVTAINFDDIVYPSNYLILDENALKCDGDWAKLPNGNPSPYASGALFGTGTPTIGSVDLYDNPDMYCGLIVSYEDTKLPTIKCVTKIMRKWTIVEWSCRNLAPTIITQMIEIYDDRGPEISGLQDITASTGNNVCEAVITLPTPTLSDNCADQSTLTVDITVYLNGGDNPGPFVKHGQSKTVSLPVGTHDVVYTAYDACKNASESTITITVLDNTPPITICDEFATVALTTDGNAYVPASIFDDGSYDGCSALSFVVKRMNPNTCGTCETPILPGFKYLGEYTVNGKKHYYYLSNDKKRPSSAFKTAKAFEGNVVSYNTLAEAGWVKDQAYSKFPAAFNEPILIGLNDVKTEGTFVWSSNEVTNYVYPWSPGQPNGSGDYVVQDKAGNWNDIDNESAEYYYVVEIEDPCGFSSFAKFCCVDIPQNQMVVFRSIDASGNYNDCMVSAVIQDKIGPTITCPADVEIDCDFVYDLNDLAKDFGSAVAYDNCQNLDIVETYVENVSNCRVGSIIRTFTVTDAGGRTASCTQTITIRSLAPYNGPLTNEWPENVSITGCGDPNSPAFSPDVLGRPILNQGACSLVGVDYVDQIFNFNNPSSPACFKILRKWTVLDWCQPLSSGGYRTWVYTQEIMVTDNVAPVINPLDAEVSADTYDAECANGTISLTASASDDCTDVLRSSYKVDLFNDGSINTTSPVSNSNSIDASGSYPVGKHRIIYTFEDKCGNISSKEQLFSIVNKKAPSGILVKGLSMTLMKIADGVGMAEIWASDFVKEASHPCGYDVVLSFEQVTKGSNGSLVIVPNLVFDCDDLGQQEVIIWIAVVTPAGDIVQTSVSTFIEIQDNNNVCGSTRTVVVSGSIATEANKALEDAAVDLVGSELHRMTNSEGAFNFGSMIVGGQYTVTPYKNDDFINGVSTFDLVLIQRHILGLEVLTSPYKYIAADANKDGKITASDLTEIRKLILGVKENFTNNTSWRFVDKNYKFVDTKNAQGEAFPETYHIDRLNTDMKTDFIAVKIGDINNDAQTNEFANNIQTRSISQLLLSTDNVSFDMGQTITVPVKVADLATISGMQFSLAFDNEMLSLVGINPGTLNVNDSNFGLNNIHNGIINVSWNTGSSIKLDANATLFTITFVTRDRGDLANLIEINAEQLNAEAYDANDDIMSIAWRVNDSKAGFELYQNSPNPFKQTTTISFNLPNAMSAHLTITDVTGKTIKSWSVQGSKGLNTVEFNQNNLPSGVLYYSVQAGDFVATKKMIVIE